MYTPITATDIIQSSKTNTDAKQHIIDHLDRINRFAVKSKFWTVESAKIQKTDNELVKNVVLFMSPADTIASPSFTLCPWAKENGCLANCINKQGRLGMENGQFAQMARTVIYLERPEFFKQKLVAELQMLEVEFGETLLVRPDGTSDLMWGWLADMFPNIHFYGYTKGITKLQKNKTPNLKLTFSGSNANATVFARTVTAITLGLKTAIALNTAGTKGEWSLPTDNPNLRDFDKNDNRYDDPDGALGFLKRKGSNKANRIAEEVAPESFFFTEDALNHLLEVTNH
jgi:hypothetical protein